MVKLQREEALDHFNRYAAGDRWSSLYDEIDDPVNFSFLIRRQRVMELLGDLSDKRVVDMGCGTGIFFEDMLNQGGTVVGADGALDMAQMSQTRARELGPDRCAVMGSIIEQIGLKDDIADKITCVGVIEYVEEEDKAVQEMMRITKPGGTIVITVPIGACFDMWFKNILSLPRKLVRSILNMVGFNVGDGTDVGRRYYRAQELDDLMERNGCVVEDRVYYFIDVFCYPFRLLSPRLSLFFLNRFEPRYRSSLLRSFARGYIVQARVP